MDFRRKYSLSEWRGGRERLRLASTSVAFPVLRCFIVFPREWWRSKGCFWSCATEDGGCWNFCYRIVSKRCRPLSTQCLCDHLPML